MGVRATDAVIALLASILLALAAGPVLAVQPVDADFDSVRLEPVTTFYCDPGARLTVEQAATKNYKPLPNGRISFGYRQSQRCWFRFALRNDTSQQRNLILDVNYGLIDELVLYRQQAGVWQSERVGDAVPFLERPLDTRKNLFPIQLAPGEQVTYLLSMKSINTFIAPLELTDHDTFFEEMVFWDWVIGGFYGIGLGMLIYNLFLWVSFRERSFLYYILYVAVTLFVLAGWHGIYFRLWPDATAFNNMLLHNLIYLGCIFTVQFAREFLESRDWPVLDRAAGLYVYSVSGLLALQLLVPSRLLVPPLAGVVLVCCALALYLGVHGWIKQRRSAPVYLLAWSSFLITAVLIALAAYGLIGGMTAAIDWLQFAIVSQQVILSIGLAMRINELRRQRDDRELVAARAQAESDARMEFLAKMSHEIRTPMNAVLGITELMNDPNLGAHDQKRYVETLHTAGQTLMHVINDILDFSKISAGKMQLDHTDFNLHELVQDSVAMMSLGAHEKSLHISEVIEEDVTEWVRGDEIRIRQILLNLLGNAIKFTDSGEIRVKVRALQPRKAGEVRVELEVRDSGEGIEPVALARLFEPFEQADGSSTRRFGGTGLGLAICRQLAELMDGSITVHSKVGEGSTFTVELGLAPGRRAAPRREHRHMAVEGLSVLVVEDNPVNQMVIRALLIKMGVTPRVAHNGKEGLDFIKLNHSQIDLVLMDCEMPEMDGYEATRALRAWETDKSMRHMYVVAMTAHAFAEHKAQCEAAGMDDHLAKPLVTRDVWQVLEQALVRKNRVTGI